MNDHLVERRARVLIVDDTPDNADAYRDYVRQQCPRWDVQSAYSSEDATSQFLAAIAHGDEFDAVVADLLMEEPDSGFSLSERLLAASPGLVAIVISAVAENFDRDRAQDSEIFDVVSKNRLGTQFHEHLIYRLRSGVSLRRRTISAERLRKFFDPVLTEHALSDPSIFEQRQQELVIAFWDLAGFSRLSKNLEKHPALLGSFLDDFFSIAGRIVNAHGGVVDKFLGDGVMAIFGLFSDDHESACTEAITAAKEIRSTFSEEVLEKHQPKFEQKSAHAIEIGLRCGIHADSVLVGVFAAGDRDHFTAIGGGVNLASRLEALAGEGEIVVSQTVASRAKAEIGSIQPDSIEGIKNISEKFPVYRL